MRTLCLPEARRKLPGCRIWFVLLCLSGFGCAVAPVDSGRLVPPSGLIQLTHGMEEEFAPAWSPDGRSVAYTLKDRNGNFDIALIDAAGGAPVLLTTNPTYDGLPSWSPDGKWIVFESDRGFHADIWRMDSRGQGLSKLTRSRESNFTPVWSPDGREILYESIPLNNTLSENRELWVMSPSGRDARKISDGFNPDGQAIFFTTGHQHLPAGVSSSDAIRVSKPYEIFTCGLSWSPDGKRIAFESVRHGSVSIWVVNRDGTQPVQLTRDLSNNWHPSWSPDGKQIAFASDRNGQYDIWIMDPDGRQARPITHDPASDFRPDWSPDGRSIVFTSLRTGNADLWKIRIPPG